MTNGFQELQNIIDELEPLLERLKEVKMQLKDEWG